MKFQPRDYQTETHDNIIEEWKSVTSTVAVLPTGGGKTMVFAMVIQSMQPRRAMVIAHREELIWQARNKIKSVTGLECGVEMGDFRSEADLLGEMPVIVSTVQTQNSGERMRQFDPKDFGVLIFDECHHSTADSYRRVMAYYKARNPEIKILGVTATPDRTDEEALGQIFETVAMDIEILDLIHGGWLVPIDQQFVSIAGLDFGDMRTTAGDLNQADLAKVMEAEDKLQGVASATIDIVGKRRAIVFTAGVAQAEMLCNIFNRHRQGMANWVCGKTNKDERRDMLAAFQRGEVQVIVNCGVLTEGFDDPGVEVIIMARPTKSRSLYAQMAGRATRTLPGLVDGIPTPEGRLAAIAASGKPSCLIVDFVGNSGRHKLISAADILGGKVSDRAVEMAIAKAKETGGAVRITDALDAEEQKIRDEIEARRLAEEARKARVVAKARFNTKTIDPFDLLQLTPVKERGWDQGKQLSDKQKAVLLRAGMNPDQMPYAHARQVLNAMFERMNKKLATIKQVATLRRYGYNDPNMSFEAASNALNSLANNGWKR
jgi:superfamily II DNA or RNA helicase